MKVKIECTKRYLWKGVCGMIIKPLPYYSLSWPPLCVARSSHIKRDKNRQYEDPVILVFAVCYYAISLN
jgi:hypothetical protein